MTQGCFSHLGLGFCQENAGQFVTETEPNTRLHLAILWQKIDSARAGSDLTANNEPITARMSVQCNFLTRRSTAICWHFIRFCRNWLRLHFDQKHFIFDPLDRQRLSASSRPGRVGGRFAYFSVRMRRFYSNFLTVDFFFWKIQWKRDECPVSCVDIIPIFSIAVIFGTRLMNLIKPDAAINVFLPFMLTVCVNDFLWRSEDQNIQMKSKFSDIWTMELWNSTLFYRQGRSGCQEATYWPHVSNSNHSWPMQLRIGDAWQILCLKARPSLEYFTGGMLITCKLTDSITWFVLKIEQTAARSQHFNIWHLKTLKITNHLFNENPVLIFMSAYLANVNQK